MELATAEEIQESDVQDWKNVIVGEAEELSYISSCVCQEDQQEWHMEESLRIGTAWRTEDRRNGNAEVSGR